MECVLYRRAWWTAKLVWTSWRWDLFLSHTGNLTPIPWSSSPQPSHYINYWIPLLDRNAPGLILSLLSAVPITDIKQQWFGKEGCIYWVTKLSWLKAFVAFLNLSRYSAFQYMAYFSFENGPNKHSTSYTLCNLQNNISEFFCKKKIIVIRKYSTC